MSKVSERGFEIPFCQILTSKGHRVLHVGHSPYEHGKDVISINPKGRTEAYQIKSGSLDLSSWQEHYPQIQALVETAIDHPAVARGAKFKPILVITGEISSPVENRIQNFNRSLQSRGLPALGIITGRTLQAAFLELSRDFWPVEPPEVRLLLSLYLSEGNEMLDKEAYAHLLERLLNVESNAPKTTTARRIAASNIFVSYLLGEFYRKENHWAVVEAWIITAGHIAWAAERGALKQKYWRSSFDLAMAGATHALRLLNREALSDKAFGASGFEVDDMTRARCTIGAGAVAAWHLMQNMNGQENPTTPDATKLLDRFVRKGRLWLWGESAVPFFLAIMWFLEEARATRVDEQILLVLIAILAKHNSKYSQISIPDPYKHVENILADSVDDRIDHLRQLRQNAGQSYTLESLIHLAARRLLRPQLTQLWPAVTHVDFVTWNPRPKRDMLLWRASGGSLDSRNPSKPQSWSTLLSHARCVEKDELPAVFWSRPDFALLFSLVYPHRLSPTLARTLDELLRRSHVAQENLATK